eukprot:TRINITY_DN11408_c0_g1_i2.p1 TRINITY_DN11408_c0_g1~~TRINITY_DN11408_c0_g1_i2.p1  ORF type:complete len:294 (-),score=26.93 TRINITY_DN11408_c0_g1_i2:49-882(-)
MGSLKRAREEDWRALAERKYIRVSGATKKKLNGLYELSDAVYQWSYHRRHDKDVPKDWISGGDCPLWIQYGQLDAGACDYRVFKQRTEKWTIGRLDIVTTETDSKCAHSEADPDGWDPTRARAWRELTPNGWQPTDLAVQAVPEDDINVVVFSAAGVDLLRKMFSPLDTIQDVLNELSDAVSHSRNVRMQLCFNGEVLKIFTMLGGLPCEGELALHAVAKERQMSQGHKCYECGTFFRNLRLPHCEDCDRRVCLQCSVPSEGIARRRFCCLPCCGTP